MYSFAEPVSYRVGKRIATLAEHLGYSRDDRLLILNADDFGLAPEVNSAIIELANQAKITSTTVIVPAAAYDLARQSWLNTKRVACGIHITLTSDLPHFPISPVSDPRQVPSLLFDGQHFHSGREQFFKHATPEDAEREATAQIEKALADGIDVSHLDSHEGTLQLRPRFAELYVRLADRFRLPVRSGSGALLERMGISADWIETLRRLKIDVPDNLVYIPIDQFDSFTEKEAFIFQLLDHLPAGVTELYFHPTHPWERKPESSGKISLPDSVTENPSGWQVREWDFAILTSPRFAERLRQNQIRLIDFKCLRDFTRSDRSSH